MSLEEKLRALLSWENLRDLGLQVLADRGSAAVPLLHQAAALGAAHERELCVKEATEDWPPDAHWPFATNDPRSWCENRARATKESQIADTYLPPDDYDNTDPLDRPGGEG